ncbi:MAG TPA: hypothetical protein VL361_00405 [Candidatus Limnocylindrales bacterium]|nr:hypothetical protein [Candidatus Limnocylindrales bacterium]
MRTSRKCWTLLVVLAAVLLIAFLSLRSGRRATASAVAMTFIGYTNLPGNDLRFALFSVSNQAPYAISWRGSWVEVEGSAEHRAETLNPGLPGFTRKAVLEAGGAMRMAIGEPLYDSENGRWRFAMSFAPYTWRARWFDFSVRHKVPLRLGSLVLIDSQRLFSPSNNINVTTAWLTK